MSYLISAVSPNAAPQAGVKRPLLGNPTTVARNFPSTKATSVGPAAPLKAPKLSQAQRPNEGTNVCIVYNRIVPLNFIDSTIGRCAPGDVLFVHKLPPGFTRKMVTTSNGLQTLDANNGPATIARVIGVDGLNRLLFGDTSPDGWMLDVNVLEVDPGGGGEDPAVCAGDVAYSASGQRRPKASDSYAANFEPPRRRFRLAVLDDYVLDGVCKSSDQEGASTHGTRDATIINVAIAGSTPVNNGYYEYDGAKLPGSGTDEALRVPNLTDRQRTNDPKKANAYAFVPSNDALRTVEAYPRGSLEAANHLSGAQRTNIFGSVGTNKWSPAGKDFISTFAGQYTTYPTQV